MASGIQIPGFRVFPVTPCRNNGVDLLFTQEGSEIVTVISFVRNQLSAMPHHSHHRLRHFDVTDLPGTHHEAQRIAMSITYEMQFAGESSARTSERLMALPPFAPAACGWARTTVASSINHSSSACRLSSSCTRLQTPARLQREKRVYAVFQEPHSGGKSRQGAPVLSRHSIASSNLRLSCAGRPTRPVSAGSKPDSRSHIQSVNIVRSIFCSPMSCTMGITQLSCQFENRT